MISKVLFFKESFFNPDSNILNNSAIKDLMKLKVLHICLAFNANSLLLVSMKPLLKQKSYDRYNFFLGFIAVNNGRVLYLRL